MKGFFTSTKMVQLSHGKEAADHPGRAEKTEQKRAVQNDPGHAGNGPEE